MGSLNTALLDMIRTKPRATTQGKPTVPGLDRALSHQRLAGAWNGASLLYA